MEIWTEFEKCNTSQKLADQVKQILKTGWFSDLEIQEMCGQVNREEYTQRELPKRYWKPNHHRTQDNNIILIQEDRKKLELIKKIMREQKTTLPSQRYQDWKEIKIEIEKVNKFLKHIPTDNIKKTEEVKQEQNKLEIK